MNRYSPREMTKWQRREIETAFATSRRVCTNSAFDIRSAPAQHDYGRVLIITPKKIGSAPERNKFRRRVKSIFYEEQLYTKGFDWIIFAKPNASTLDFQTLKTLLCACAQKLSSGS